MKKLVIIPTYNEKENIGNIISAVFGLKEDFHVLIVDDFLKGGGTITGMISLLSEFDSELVGVAVFAENAKGDRDIHEYKSLLTVSDIDVKAQKVEVEVGNIFDK